MYQIFVVEDELLIRQSIRDAIEKMQGPYVFCGEASDGEMALSMMQDLMPDILLTDIRMPFLDGFGLIRHAKAMMPWLKVAVISGYGEFEYTQQAIGLGVDQYLLKPVRQADLFRAVEEMAAQIEKDRKSPDAIPGRVDEDQVMAALREQFMRQLLYGGADTGELLEKARLLKMDMVRSHYLLSVSSFDLSGEGYRAVHDTVRRITDGMADTACCFNGADRMTLLAYDNDPEALSERMYQLINILRHELKDACPAMTTVISNDTQRLGAIAEAYKTAAGLLKTIGGAAAGQTVNVSDTAQLTADIVLLTDPFGAEFRQKLQYAGPEEAEALLAEALSARDGAQPDNMQARYAALISLMRTAVALIARRSPETGARDIAARLSGEYDLLSAAESGETFRETARDMLREAVSTRQEAAGGMKYSHVISRAENYVRENYTDPNISLISVARHVGMSAAHFSTVFSQTTGRSFITYLTAMRMDRARELLRNTGKRLSDIAMEIGYNEPNYFSHVFRKTEGMTPKEYRSRNGNPEA